MADLVPTEMVIDSDLVKLKDVLSGERYHFKFTENGEPTILFSGKVGRVKGQKLNGGKIRIYDIKREA